MTIEFTETPSLVFQSSTAAIIACTTNSGDVGDGREAGNLFEVA